MVPPRSWALRVALRLAVPMTILGCFFVWPCYELHREASSRTVLIFLIAYAVGGTLAILPFEVVRRKQRRPAPWKQTLGSELIVFLLWPFLVFQGAAFGLLIALLYRPRPDSDVTSSPEYSFSEFAGTVWQTKLKVALADLKQYTGRRALHLLVPKHFDATHPEYTPARDMQIIAVHPPGTRLRIERLMKDNGNWGGVRVAAELEDGTYSQKTVYLDDSLLAKNRFIWPGWSDSKDWGVDPDMLEKAE
jgi:hypothetical protein